MPIQIYSVEFGADPYPIIELDAGFETELVLQVSNPEIIAAPASLTVSVFDALAPDDIVFRVDGREVLRHESDPDGSLELVSVPVPNFKDANQNPIMMPGTHTLEVSQASGIGTLEFKILDEPAGPPEDASSDVSPVFVPGSLQPDGTRRWVFQDLMPGGIGSWVLPMNPVDMESPPFTRELSVKTTTASEEVGGQFHIWENDWTPVEWKFNGYCPTEEMREQLEAYDALERRWYLHDHRGRAWKVVSQLLELTPRLTQIWNGEYTNEGHDYGFTVTVTDREWTDV